LVTIATGDADPNGAGELSMTYQDLRGDGLRQATGLGNKSRARRYILSYPPEEGDGLSRSLLGGASVNTGEMATKNPVGNAP
jgi:hypothetical protein